MRFEWDEAKNLINIQKHGIDFQDACEIFSSPLLEWEQANTLQEHGEIRFNAIGLLKVTKCLPYLLSGKMGLLSVLSL
jgi:uncharacterized protein